jgi:hypothetical protein
VASSFQHDRFRIPDHEARSRPTRP